MKYEGTKLADFEPRDQVTELEIIDKEIGTGDEVSPGATVTAHYTGALCKNGIIFQSSHDFGDAISFPLDGVIKGRAPRPQRVGHGHEGRRLAPTHHPR